MKKSTRRSADGQQDLFAAVRAAYQGSAQMDNDQLYAKLASSGAIKPGSLDERTPIGRAAQRHNTVKRRVRWIQQTLKAMGAIERVPGQRGTWQLKGGDEQLTAAAPGRVLVAFSTSLGLALWADCSALGSLSEPVSLVLSSPPYPLARPRAYGNPTQDQFSEFICRSLEPVLRSLVPGGSVCLNVSNDIFRPGSPARSTYLERLTLDIERRLGLFLMDRLIWVNPSKPPGPTMWACRERVQLVHSYEPVLWFSSDPARCLADNGRVLKPHTSRHQRLQAKGGEQRDAEYGDGAHRLRPGSFSGATEGSIPRNVLHFPHEAGKPAAEFRDAVQASGLPAHGALMPRALARFLIEFLTPPGALVADLFGGWLTTAIEAEATGRRWVVTERFAQYIAASAWRFKDVPGFHSSFDFVS